MLRAGDPTGIPIPARFDNGIWGWSKAAASYRHVMAPSLGELLKQSVWCVV